jgi:hypothetical protein
LLTSARELRFPLTIGYAVLLTIWVLFGEDLAAAARRDALGQRLLAALDSLGTATVIGIVTFAAGMLGSLLWHVAIARLVRFISVRNGHPNWSQLTEDARQTARLYGEYQVVTYKGTSGGKLSPFDARHTVPSSAWAAHLVERVQERERKADEMTFRMTLALALIPVALAVGVKGGGLWWLSLIAIPAIWLDLAFLKHTTLRTVNRFRVEDLEERLRNLRDSVTTLEARLIASVGAASNEADRLREQITTNQADVDRMQAELDAINSHTTRRTSKLFAWLEGEPAG